MKHRHLLPDEIDQLLDGEAGFGVAPLLSHVEECPTCREELAEARQVVSALERMPHFAPSPTFSRACMMRSAGRSSQPGDSPKRMSMASCPRAR